MFYQYRAHENGDSFKRIIFVNKLYDVFGKSYRKPCVQKVLFLGILANEKSKEQNIRFVVLAHIISKQNITEITLCLPRACGATVGGSSTLYLF